MQNAGVTLAIIIDNVPDSTHESTALFAMSGDGKDDIEIPAVFLFSQEGRFLTDAYLDKPEMSVTVGELKALKAQYEDVCDDGNCETVLETPNVSNDKESFEHLKKVLSQLATQFELSLSNDDQKSCSDESKDVVFIKDKYTSEDGSIEGPPSCSVKSDTNNSEQASKPVVKDDSEDKEDKSDKKAEDGF